MDDSDSDEETVLLVHLLNTLEKRRKRRNPKEREIYQDPKLPAKQLTKKGSERTKAWVNDHIADCTAQFGSYGLMKQLIADEEQIATNLNITSNDFYDLLDLIKEDLTKQTTSFRMAVSAELRLAATLRYLVTGTAMKNLSNELGLGSVTLCGIVHDTCLAICHKLQSIAMPNITTEMLEESAKQFEERCHFPNCVGVLEGKHFEVGMLRRTLPDDTDIINYFQKNSVVLFALVDATNCFLAANVIPGDQSIIERFQISLLDSMFLENSMPPPKLLPESSAFLPYVTLAHGTFPHCKYLMTPYPDGTVQMLPEKSVYNEKHYETLKVAEETFGLLVQRFKLFHNCHKAARYDLVVNSIKACFLLHNFIRKRELSRNEGRFDASTVSQEVEKAKFLPLPFPFESTHRSLSPATAKEVRDNFCNYFLIKSVTDELETDQLEEEELGSDVFVKMEM